jgi:hypothetical protein
VITLFYVQYSMAIYRKSNPGTPLTVPFPCEIKAAYGDTASNPLYGIALRKRRQTFSLPQTRYARLIHVFRSCRGTHHPHIFTFRTKPFNAREKTQMPQQQQELRDTCANIYAVLLWALRVCESQAGSE